MDFLNKAMARLSDLFRTMTPGARITTGLLLVVAVVGAGYLFQHPVSGGDDYLFGGESMQTPTLQKMEEAFGHAGLNGFTMEGGRVKVPHAQRAAYLAALADAKALPTNSGQALKAAADGGLFEAPATSQRRFNLALQEEMSLVISRMKGIERASVIIDVQAQSGLGLSPLKTASVAVQAVGGVPLDDEQVDKIRYYVAAANAGMKPENVTIVDENGRVHPGSEADRNGFDGDPYNRAVRKTEQALNAKIREALAYIPNLTVTSTVMLDREAGNRSVEARNERKLAKVSVGIPASYYGKVWQDRNQANESEEPRKPDQAAIEKIRAEIVQDVRNLVATLLPLAPEGKDPASLVTVTTFQDIKAAEPQAPSPAQRALTWLGQNWPMAAMIGLVLFSLGMLRSTGGNGRRPGALPARPESAAGAMRAAILDPKSQGSGAAVAATAARRRTAGTGPSLRDELSELVKEDPDSAASILRTWIGQGSQGS